MGSSQPSPPPAPNQQQSYATGVQTYLQYLPQLLAAEQASRGQYDPQRIAEQQGLQAQFGPTQYSQMLQALQQLNPEWYKLQGQLGNYLSGQLANPENQALYSQLGQNVTGDLAQGYKLAPGMEHQLEQQVRGSQSARGNTLGSAAGTAEAYALGDRAQQLYQQRLTNASGYLNMMSPYQRAVGNALNYQQASTPAQQLTMIPPVQADRSMAYVNPNAGFQGQQFALQNYQNQLAAMGLQNQSNPWSSTLGSLGSLAGGIIGNIYGGPVGGYAGSTAGGISGQYVGSLFNKGGVVEDEYVPPEKYTDTQRIQQERLGPEYRLLPDGTWRNVSKFINRPIPEPTPYNKGGVVAKNEYVRGGAVRPAANPLQGYGKDTVPAALTPGEVVIPRPGDTTDARRNYLLAIASRRGRVKANEGWGDPGIEPTPIPGIENMEGPSWAESGLDPHAAAYLANAYGNYLNNPFLNSFAGGGLGNRPMSGLPGYGQGPTMIRTYFDKLGYPFAPPAGPDYNLNPAASKHAGLKKPQ